MDFIHLRDIRLSAVVGIHPHERSDPQPVVLNLSLGTAAVAAAAATDHIRDAVDYDALRLRVRALVESSSFFLIETLAEKVAMVCLEDSRIQQVRVVLDKPNALPDARSAAVEITRQRPE